MSLTRRAVLGSVAPLLLGAARAPRVACLMNVWFPDSHADVFVSRLLDGYRLDHEWHPPRLAAASFYVDQFPANDMAREEAEEHGVRIYPTVAEALRLGGPRLAVDAIAVIGEHGNYPRTRLGNFMYPRWRYFDEVTRVMQEEGRVVPMYSTSTSPIDWDDAQVRMYDRVREMRIPLQCGSTVPLAWQRPPLEIPRGTRFTEVLTTSYSDLEEHAYHAIELLQAMAERRPGGETGVARVRLPRRGSLARPRPTASGRVRCWMRRSRAASTPCPRGRPAEIEPPQAFLIRYRDGLRGAVIASRMAMTRDLPLRRAHRRPRRTGLHLLLHSALPAQSLELHGARTSRIWC